MDKCKIVPLISSTVSGPLGVLHLPRLWQKCILGAKEMLADGYPEISKGLCQMTLDALKLNKEETLEYLHGEVPSYPEFEAWILAKNGGKLDPVVVEKHNAAVLARLHDERTRKGILDAAGIRDEGRVKHIKAAVTLNDWDDWTEFHKQIKEVHLYVCET